MHLKNPVGELFYTLGVFARLLAGSRHYLLHGRAFYKTLVMQILFTFVDALGITAFLALGIGAAVNVIGMPFLAGLGQTRMIYPLLIIIITRELGPLLAAFIVIARSATAIATEMAGMVVSHEIEAYISVGADPLEQLGAPRFIGITLSMFLLTVFFSIFGLAGSYVPAQLFNAMPAAVYFDNLVNYLTLHDLVISIIKSLSFGMIISVTAIMRGIAVDRASTEIPVAGLKAVSNGFVWVILTDILLSAIYYVLYGVS
jgi:phospholipid/cholesterol/gamma-HCH transport system permease protein